jgi:hypothetical protein
VLGVAVETQVEAEQQQLRQVRQMMGSMAAGLEHFKLARTRMF